MSDEAADRLERAVGLWRKVQVVHEGPTRQGFPEPLEAMLEIARGHLECHDGLVRLLVENDQLVVAYALLTLQMMGSHVLEELPEGLLGREKITIDIGSFRSSMDLGWRGRSRSVRGSDARKLTGDGQHDLPH